MIQIAETEFVAISALFVHSIAEYEKLRADLYAERSNHSVEQPAAQ